MAGGLGNGLGWVGGCCCCLFVCCFVSVQVTGWHGEDLVWLGWAGLDGAVRDGSWDGMGCDGMGWLGWKVSDAMS